MVSIARKNLFQDLPRLIVAQAGIMFAVGLITIQTGLLNGFTRSSSLLLDYSNADIWIAHEDIRHLDLTLPIPYERVQQAANIAGVERTEPLLSQSALWRYAVDQLALVRMIAIDPDGKLFRPEPVLAGNLTALHQPYAISIDEMDQQSLDVDGINHTAEIGSYRAKVVAITSGVRSIVSSPYVFTSLANGLAFLNSPVAPPITNQPSPQAPTATSNITFVLVKAKPGQNIEQLRQQLEAALPNTRVLTQPQLVQITQDYWRNSTGVGYILGLGAIVGVIVGTVVVGQILYSSVSDHLREFGTLKAMGSPDGYIYRIILEQALWMAVLGYVPGMALSVGLGALTVNAQAVQILISPAAAGAIFGITVVMCSGAAIFAIQKVTHLDPAMVFKS
jgi:putative ABC transport system permease protein